MDDLTAIRQAVDHLRAIHDHARQLERLELPIVRANATRLVAAASELLTVLELDPDRHHPVEPAGADGS